MAKQVTPATAQGGTTLTYTLAVTVTGGAFNGVVVTDTLPANVAFVGLGSANAGSAAFDSAHSLLTWSLPGSLPPGAYSLTYQTQVNALAPAGTPVINGALLSYPGLSHPLSAAATVQVTGSYTIRVGVYNEAGELIKSLQVFQTSNAVNSLTLEAPQITHLTGAGSVILLYSRGTLLGSWDGTNASGDPVSNGVYHIQVESVDSYGVATTVTQEAVVSRQLAQISAAVYNEAGEVVKHLTAWVDDASGAGMTDVTLSAKSFSPGTSQPVQIFIQSSSSPVTLTWDGTDDSGNDVTSGSYLLSVHWFDGQGQGNDISKAILVTAQGPRQGQDVVAEPNLLRISSGQSRVQFLDLSGQGSTLKVSIYTLAGELTASFQGEAGTGQASWDASGLASGIYLAAVEKRTASGGSSGRQILKIMVVR